MEIIYTDQDRPTTEEIIDLYLSAGLKRPVEDTERIARMYANSNLIVTARMNGQLIGVSRALTDHGFCCYLSDLAVRKEFQSAGIGKQLVSMTKKLLEISVCCYFWLQQMQLNIIQKLEWMQ